MLKYFKFDSIEQRINNGEKVTTGEKVALGIALTSIVLTFTGLAVLTLAIF